MPAANPYQLLQFMICAGQFSGAFDKLSSEVVLILHFLPGIKRLSSIIEEKHSEIKERTLSLDLKGDLSFSHISFQNPENGNLILKNVSFDISPGQFIAFIGRSGAGKSSVFKLLLGLDSPCAGEIKVNGKNISHFDIREIRKQFGVVLQSTNLLPGTLFSNISANTKITLDEAWELAKYVGLDEEINKMPMKMYTHISDNASESLSGGQKQKILIARALATKPKILLLDEATSALDNKSQAHIYHYLRSLNMTRIVIAHRYSTIVNADRIYVMDKGKIIDYGTYNELVQKGQIPAPGMLYNERLG
jgi:ABC-type bacteriocin/lantibiotic exporter with double-glycine peptidase domain